MTKYSKDYIAKLLDRYLDGTSTLGEEDILADYFHRGNVPEEWADFQQLFQEIEAMKPQSKVRKRWIGWSVAASVAVLLVADGAAGGTASYGKNISSTDRKG